MRPTADRSRATIGILVSGSPSRRLNLTNQGDAAGIALRAVLDSSFDGLAWIVMEDLLADHDITQPDVLVEGSGNSKDDNECWMPRIE